MDDRTDPPVVSIVTGQFAADLVPGFFDAYRAVITAGLPPSILATYALDAGHGEVRIMTIWRSRADLETMRSWCCYSGPPE